MRDYSSKGASFFASKLAPDSYKMDSEDTSPFFCVFLRKHLDSAAMGSTLLWLRNYALWTFIVLGGLATQLGRPSVSDYKPTCIRISKPAATGGGFGSLRFAKALSTHMGS